MGHFCKSTSGCGISRVPRGACLAGICLASLAFGEVPVTPGEFSRLLDDIETGNRWHPAGEAERAGWARAYAAQSGGLEERILAAVAAAPGSAVQNGYRSARFDLIKLLGPLSENEGQPDPLVKVDLRLGLSDLSLRHGEIRFSLRQLLDVFEWMPEPLPTSYQERLLEQAARILVAAGYAFDALALLDELPRKGSAFSPETFAQRQLLRAEALWEVGQLGGMRATLDQLLDTFDPETSRPVQAAYWMMSSWHALASGSISRAQQFLRQARQVLDDQSPLVEGDLLMLEACLASLNRGAIPLIEDKLGAAQAAYGQAAFPSRYARLLIVLYTILKEKGQAGLAPRLLQELASFAHREDDLRACSHGFSAWVDLLLLEEQANLGQVVGLIEKREAHQVHFDRVMRDLLASWHAQSHRLRGGAPVEVEETDEASGGMYYLVLVLMVLLVLLLVLALRMHSQRHLARQLESVVEKARLAERAAEESSRLKSQFLANVSHEIKTPMSGLVGMASLLEELVTDKDQRTYLATIRSCSENMLVLINDLLDLGRMESGHFEIEYKPVQVRSVVAYSLQIARAAARDKADLMISEELAPELPVTVMGDPTRIGQVLTNLLNNAVKFTEKGHVVLRLRFERTVGSGGNLLFEVEDTGKGISPDKLSSIFEPFTHEDFRFGKNYGGSGLGLAISRKLVELMGGVISVRSWPGQGTLFSVKIPVRI